MFKKYMILIDSNADDVIEPINEEVGYSSDDYSKYLQLPFSINEKADGSYDTASITLSRMSRKEPFKPNSMAEILIYKDEMSLIGDGEPYAFIVEEDKVEKYYLGNRVFYKHDITLIERTKILDNILLPSFTITQPKDAVFIKKADINNTTVDYEGLNLTDAYPYSSSSGSYRYSKKRLFSYTKEHRKDFSFSIFGQFISIYLTVDLVTHAPENYTLTVDKINYVNNRVLFPIPSWFTNNSTVEGGNSLEVNIEITKNSSSLYKKKYVSQTYSQMNRVYDVFLEYDDTRKNIGYISVRSDGTHQIVSTAKSDNGEDLLNSNGILLTDTNTAYTIRLMERIYTSIYASDDSFPFDGWLTQITYDLLKVAIKNSTLSYSSFFNLFPPFYSLLRSYKGLSNSDINKLHDNEIEAYLQTLTYLLLGKKGDVVLPDSWTNVDNNGIYQNTNTVFPYYYENTFKNNKLEYGLDIIVGVTTSSSLVETEKIEFIYSSSGKNIGSLLNKTISLIDPSCGTFTIEKSPEMNLILDVSVPEKVYGSKTVSEILFEQGKLVNAYPYLDNDNKIKLRIVNPKDNPLFNDSEEDEKTIFGSDNNVSAYITDTKYMVGENEKIYSYWPDRSNFEKPNSDFSAVSINPDNAGITIQSSDGINELIYIKVKNCLVGSEDTVIDITNFCLEKTVYDSSYTYSDSLSISNRAKNNTFYWTKGSNFISFGALTSQMAVSIFGSDAPTEYALIRAIKNSAELQLPSSNFKVKDNKYITDFQFQVCYVDQINGRIKTEKFNSEENEKTVMSNNNQTENKISSIDWNDMSQTDILRRGNLDITKTVIIRDLKKLPVLGEFKQDENTFYFADDITYIFNNNLVTATVNFTKDYSKINKNVAIYKDYRQYELYTSDIVERTVNIDRYIYLSLGSKMENSAVSALKYTDQILRNENNEKTSKRLKTPMYMLVYFHKDADGTPLTYNNLSSSGELLEENKVPGILLPISYSASGNTIIMKSQCYDNFTAAYYSTDNYLDYYDYWGNLKKSSSREMNDVRYVDNFGEAKYCSIYIIKPGYESNFFNNNIFPKTNVKMSEIVDEWILDREEFKPLYKDNKEKLIFIYQFHFLTNDNRIKWHPALCKYILYDQNDKNELYLNDSGVINLDNQMSVYGSVTSIKNYNYINEYFDKLGPVSADESNDSINSETLTLNKDYYGYAIGYPKTGEILFHINDMNMKAGSYTPEKIYFNYFTKKQ